MSFVESLTRTDDSLALHSARLLILIRAFAGEDQTQAIEGLTKLAKLDFLLRYPVMLTRALQAKKKPTKNVALEENEQHSVETEMVRYRFGPWDHRYREYLNCLVARNLASVSVEGRKVVISPTQLGIEVADRLAGEPEFEIYARRSRLLRANFDMTATNLMKFIYETFPEIVSLKSNERIKG